jgi:hypothetical protein
MKPCSAKTDGVRPRDERQDIGAEDRLPALDGTSLAADGHLHRCRLPGPRGDGSDQARRQRKPAGQVPQPLRGQELVIERHPVEHLIEQPRIATADPDGEQDECLGIDGPPVGALGGR